MAADNYKEFDTASVVTTSSTAKDTVSIGRFALRKRELLLALIAIAALLGVLVLAIVLATRASESDSGSKVVNEAGNGWASKQTDGKVGGQPPTVDYCYTSQCLQAATYQKPIINDNIDPCQDFYTFACGHYKDHHQRTPLLEDVTAENEIADLNQRRLAYLTLYPIDKDHVNSYERKFQDFISSCSNHFDKMELRGVPMIEHVIKPLGGWWVFGDDVLASFSLQDSLEKVHIDLWTAALFTFSVTTNINSWNEQIVQMDFGGLGLSHFYYGDSDNLQPIHDYYKRYMHLVASMLSIDNALTPDIDKVTTFSEDAFEVEKNIAQILYSTQALRNPHHEDNLMTLSNITHHLNDTIDMVRYMKTMFNEYPSKFEADTKIAVSRLGYFDRLGPLLAGYLQSQEGIRKLHNYLTWRAIEGYVNDLSWDYVHAARKLNHVMYGYKDDSSGFNRCFLTAFNNFPDAMNALFVKHFVKDEGKRDAEEMLENVRTVLLDKIEDMPWMSRSNKNYAMRKIRNSLYKIGFPSEIVDEDALNNKYALINVNMNDYFGTVISLHKMKRHLYNKMVGQPGARTEWSYHIFEPEVDYYNPWHELILTSAFLQNPLFSPKGPKYYNYGGVGSILAQNLVHAIDSIGASYKEDGSHFGMWWTDSTLQHYAKIRQCAIDAQRGTTLGPFVSEGGTQVQVNTSIFADAWTPTLLADATGARISLTAYKNLMKKEGIEKLPPGFEHFTRDQMFFLSFAQSYCQNTPDSLKYAQLINGIYPGKNRVNLALQHVPEFHTAFSCPRDQQTKPCLFF